MTLFYLYLVASFLGGVGGANYGIVLSRQGRFQEQRELRNARKWA